MDLSKIQKIAVQTIGKNILVSAGAGTGKTRVLVERILHLLCRQKATLSELLVLTFTEKAAHEIKTRLSGSFREWNLERPRRDLEKAAISTFHSFAARLLKEHPIEAGVDPDFRVIETEQSELLKEEAMIEVFAKFYSEKDGAFEFLPVYGKDVTRDGIFKVLTAARHEGKSLREFFLENEKKEQEVSSKREKELPSEAQALLSKLGEIDAQAWARFLNNKNWDERTFLDFRAWSALYKGKRKEGWKEWRALLEDLEALRLGLLAAPWKEKFESLALAFEAAYGAKKKEKSFLDFDDLQMKAVGLFRGEKPALRKLRERYQRQFKFILVDEFQDTNFLQMEFIELLSSGNNLFMVGDYKQSIYGFRGAEPGIFLAKEKLYGDGTEGTRILLAENFRSDPPVLDFTNRFFETLWTEDGLPFEPLVAHAAIKDEKPPQGPAVEALVTELKENEDMRYARLREARAIATRVREIHEQDKVPYGGIAVLFQAMTLSGIYEDAFKSAGVPYFIVAGRGFYEQPEIQDVMSFLSHLERPLADIPLAATLRSPFFHITDDTLFWLSRQAKTKDEEAPLSHALKTGGSAQEILPEQRARLEAFLKLTAALGELKDRVPLSELIDKILEGTGYELSVLMDPKGVRRYANLKKLVAMVREYETYERMPLAAFLNILKRLKAQEVRESEAQIVLETGAEAVRMMSVHAAKGLEFPVVFVADLGRQGSRSDSKTVIAHAADGYAMQVPVKQDPEMQRPYFFRWVDGEIARRDEEEWKRLFYVAVTRAKSRLFLSGVHKKKKEEKKNFREMASWMDWVMAICGEMRVQVTHDLNGTAGLRGKTEDKLREKVEALVKDISWEREVPESSEPRVPGLLPSRSIDLPVSAYVLFQKDPSEFWRRYQIGWTLGEDERPGEDAVFTGEDFSAADFGTASAFDFFTERAAETAKSMGTAMHGFFEHWDLENPGRALDPETLERVFGRFGKDAVRDARKILQDFIKQPVFLELGKARQIKREIDFVLNERHGLIYGKIDLLFEDSEGRWHILDYKTAAGDEAAAHKSAYDLQLEIYALAAERILKLPVRSARIYYLKNQKAVAIPIPFNRSEAVPTPINFRESEIGAAQTTISEKKEKVWTEIGDVPAALIQKKRKAGALSFSAEKSAVFFDGLEEKVRGLQQKILDYSNERMIRECEVKEAL